MRPFRLKVDNKDEHLFFQKGLRHCYSLQIAYRKQRAYEGDQFTAILLFMLMNESFFLADRYKYTLEIPTATLLRRLKDIHLVLEDFPHYIPKPLYIKLQNLLADE
jgi:hypothetical protein